MQSDTPSDVSRLLDDWRRGDAEALDRLMPLVYARLHSLASGYLRRERPDHTLQPTAVVHEAYLQLVGKDRPQWAGRVHFFVVAAQLMRRVLVDHARSRRAAKRGGDLLQVTLDGLSIDGPAPPSVDLIALDGALQQLAEVDERKSRVIELRYFGGLTVAETADVLGVSNETVHLDARLARAWLQDRLL